MDSILHYNFLSNVSIPLLIRLDLTKGADGKYWISKWVLSDNSGSPGSRWPANFTTVLWVMLFLAGFCREKSNIPTDLKMIGMVLFPSLISIGKILGLTAGIGTGAIGRAVPITSS
jgi:hypothetical protein